jgi:hypothetical protein
VAHELVAGIGTEERRGGEGEGRGRAEQRREEERGERT